MKKKRYTEEQIIKILREAETGKSIRDVCRKHAVTEQTFYRWRKQYAGMEAADVRRLRDLEKENSRLKKLLAERDMELDIVKDVFKKNGIPLSDAKSRKSL